MITVLIHAYDTTSKTFGYNHEWNTHHAVVTWHQPSPHLRWGNGRVHITSHTPHPLPPTLPQIHKMLWFLWLLWDTLGGPHNLLEFARKALSGKYKVRHLQHTLSEPGRAAAACLAVSALPTGLPTQRTQHLVTSLFISLHTFPFTARLSQVKRV